MAIWRGWSRQLCKSLDLSAASTAEQGIFSKMDGVIGMAASLGALRGKKVKATGSTKNKCGHPKGKKRGIKVYDGQRISEGSMLVSQLRLSILPGWNVRFRRHNDLGASCHGRVMITTEKCDPKYGYDIYKVERYFPEHIRNKNIFRMHVHVIPDEQHQYFKLVEQV